MEVGKKLESKKMRSVRGNNDDGSISKYEQGRLATIERNKRKLESLNIPRLNTIAKNPVQGRRPRKTAKKIHNASCTSDPHNLLPRAQRSKVQHQEELLPVDVGPLGDFLGDNEDLDNENQNTKKQRNGRGITKKENIFSRTPDMPKITILLNDRGQPVGKNSRELSSVIGCQVRKKLSLASLDWRLVDAEKKYELWTDIKAFYDINDDAFNWFMRTVGRKWKEFKATIKELYFSEDMTAEEMTVSQDKRVNDADWSFLFTYWMSPQSQTRTEIAKANRAKALVPHTVGSVNFACSEHDLAIKLGRRPRRDENYIKTHTRKNGVPATEAEPIINQLKEIVEAQPELKDRTIQEGDAFADVRGEKEPRGYVRVLGLGPTPQDVGTPGLKCYMPTRLQMEILARKKAENEKAALEKHCEELRAQMAVMQTNVVQDRASAEPISQNGSITRQVVNTRSDEDEDDEDFYSGDDDFADDDNQIAIGQTDIVAPLRHVSGQLHVAAPSNPTRNSAGTEISAQAHCSTHDSLVGKEVILYAILRSDQPVTKGTICSTKPSTILGGQPLGRQFCKVIVTHVLKRDALLPRPLADIETMANAKMMSIAWPYKKLKVCSKASTRST